MNNLKSRFVRESAVEDHVYKIFPNDLNANGTVFGGMIMSVLDRIALVVAERHSERVCVTVSIDSVHFLAPAGEGDVLIFKAAINKAWNSSMEIGVKVIAESLSNAMTRHILSAYFTFVALDDHKRPTKVPAVATETEDEQRRYEEAEMRRSLRKKEMEDRKKYRDSRL
jgi:acyl-CoA hydrolase